MGFTANRGMGPKINDTELSTYYDYRVFLPETIIVECICSTAICYDLRILSVDRRFYL